MTRDQPSRGLATLAAFLLPLGTLGIGGVVAVGLHLLAFGRRPMRGDARLVAAALPLALTLPAATLLHVSQTGIAPSVDALVHAWGMAAVVLVGPVALRRMIAHAGAELVSSTFVVGSVGLALSVIVDAALAWHPVPGGLFLRGDLHNVAAAILVVAFPLALDLASSRRQRVWWTLAALAIAIGVGAAWSWVGALGLVAAALTFAVLRWGRAGAVLTGLAAATVASIGWWMLASGVGRLPALSTLGEVMSSRARIFAQGLELAALRPWAGWGSHLGDLAGPLGAVGRYHVDDLALPHFHSLYVQSMFESGVPGLMALALWFGYLLLAARGPWAAAARAALVGFLVTQAFDLAWTRSMVALGVLLVAMLGLPPEPIWPRTGHASSRVSGLDAAVLPQDRDPNPPGVGGEPTYRGAWMRRKRVRGEHGDC